MILFKRPLSLSWHLVALVLASMIPVLIFSSVLVRQLVVSKRELSEKRLQTAARQLARAVDQEIASSIRTLELLAASEELQHQNLRGFHKRIVQKLPTQKSWGTILLHSAQGKLLLSASRRFGEKLTTVEPQSLKTLFETGKPIVGFLSQGKPATPFVGRYGSAVRVPVSVNGKIRYALSAVILSGSIQNLVLQLSTPEVGEWTRAVLDASGTVVARSREPEKFVGSAATPTFMELIKINDQGLVRSRTLEGKDVYLAFQRAPYSKWLTAVAVPLHVLDAPVKRALSLVLITGAGLLLSFGGIALLYSRYLALHIRRSAAASLDLIQGKLPEMKSTMVLEVEQLSESLRAAAKLLQQRDADRSEHLEIARKARAEAERANRSKGEFLANMSHELRTPIGVILGFLDLLTNPKLNEEERENLKIRIRRNAEYLSSLIDQVLDISKVEAKALQVELSSFSLQQLIDDLLVDLEPKASAKGIYLSFQVVGPIPDLIRSDALRLRQILVNVVGNAIKFTQDGGVTVTLHSRPLSTDEANAPLEIEFLVKDTGIGIGADQKERLFQPFSQGDTSMSRRFGGTGLGLVLSKRLAELLGGDIELVESQEGVGSVFRIRIVDTGADHGKFLSLDEKNRHKSHSDLAISVHPLRGMRILLVDDSADNRLLLSRYLESAGARVLEAENGRIGVDLARAQEVDVVLMDIRMPTMDGNQATMELRKTGFTKPIIAITAHAMKDEREEALQSGYNDYLTKPIDRSRLIDLLAEFQSVERRANA